MPQITTVTINKYDSATQSHSLATKSMERREFSDREFARMVLDTDYSIEAVLINGIWFDWR